MARACAVETAAVGAPTRWWCRRDDRGSGPGGGADPEGTGWGLGAVQRLRLRYLRPAGSPGHLIDVCYAHDLYAPAADGRIPQWADVVRAVVPVVKRGGYDVLIVDTLGSWIGNDASNVVMQEALGALRQVSALGVAVLMPHHCAKSAEPPYQPRGGGAILGALDICWSLSRLSNDPKDARRLLDCSGGCCPRPVRDHNPPKRDGALLLMRELGAKRSGADRRGWWSWHRARQSGDRHAGVAGGAGGPRAAPPPLPLEQALEVLPGGGEERLRVDLGESSQAEAPQPVPLFGLAEERLHPDLPLAEGLLVDPIPTFVSRRAK